MEILIGEAHKCMEDLEQRHKFLLALPPSEDRDRQLIMWAGKAATAAMFARLIESAKERMSLEEQMKNESI